MRLMHPAIYLDRVTPLELLRAAWHGTWMDTRKLSRYTMSKLDQNIYGADETSVAEACSAAALANPHPNDNSGAPTGAEPSKGGGQDVNVAHKGDVVVKSQGMSKDSRAVSKGGHGATEGYAKGKE